MKFDELKLNAHILYGIYHYPLNHVLCVFKGLLRKYVPLIAEGLTR